MYLPHIQRWALTFGAALLPLSAFAEQQANEPPAQANQPPVQMTQPPVVWGLGIGVSVAERPYTNMSNKTVVFPNFLYISEHIRVAVDAIDLKLASQDQWTFALRVRYSLLDGYKSGDAPILSGMNERSGGGWMGGAITLKTDFAKITLEALGDVSGKSNGRQAALKFERDFRSGSFMLTPHAAIRYADNKYVNYYFGVTSSEATTYRSTYEGTSTVNYQIGLRTSYTFDRKQTVFLEANSTALGKGITDSPLVDKKTIPLVAVGYLYRF